MVTNLTFKALQRVSESYGKVFIGTLPPIQLLTIMALYSVLLKVQGLRTIMERGLVFFCYFVGVLSSPEFNSKAIQKSSNFLQRPAGKAWRNFFWNKYRFRS